MMLDALRPASFSPLQKPAPEAGKKGGKERGGGRQKRRGAARVCVAVRGAAAPRSCFLNPCVVHVQRIRFII